jgi:hypothetical protein
MPHPVREKPRGTCGNHSLTNVEGWAPQRAAGRHLPLPASLKQQAFGEVATGSMAVGAAAFAANGGAASAISYFA